MKRAIWSIVFGGAVVFAAAQGSFTIVRPFDGSKVRETVKILMPKSSVPDAGYIGVFVDGQFVEATVPKETKDGKYLEYSLDTKALADGNHKLEVKLYVDYSSQPRIVDTSSVDLLVANKSSIEIPEDGISLRYNFKPGTERIYRLQQRTISSVISEADAKKNSDRPFQISEDGEAIKMLYACDNAYANGEGLVRMQVIPDKGINNREYSKLTASGETGPKKYFPADMAPIYMRITSTGREVFGSIPDYFGIDGKTGGGNRFALFAAFPLPVLPSKSIKPGDSWQSAFQMGAIDLNKRAEVKSVQETVLARGEFVGVEWQMGHPCAKIKNSIAQGTPVKTKKDGKEQDIADRKVSVEETIWFALDIKQVVQYYRDITTEGKANFGFATGGGGDAGASGDSGAAGPQPGGRGGGKSPDDFKHTNVPLNAQRGGARPPSGGGPPAGAGGPQGARGPQGGPGGPGGAAPQQQSFVRIRQQFIFTLEK